MGSRVKRAARKPRGEKTGLARYYQLYLALSNALRDGSYAAGDVLPSEPDLMRKFRLSRSTVRRALLRLQQEKRIVRRHGSGTYASESPDGERTHFSQSSFIDNARALETTTTTRLLQFRQVATPARLLKLAPDFGPSALHIERARAARGKPYALLEAYVTPKWGRKLSRTVVGNRAIVVALTRAGANFSIAHQFYGAMLADQQQAKYLSVPVGTPLLHVTSLFREKNGHVTHCEEWFLRSDIHSLHAVIEVA
ncbi:MAG TPA: GntR family transcriptional regulator [Steroidobacteraceae bacterium]|jgi:GntR family transcriptional regulator